MNNQQNAFFFEIKPISNSSLIFNELKNQQLFFSYFQVDPHYYLFFYGQESIKIDLIDPFIDILKELDKKQRQIRSLRGFFFYAIEIMDNGKNLKILKTNLKSSFWENFRKILRQNKKVVLLKFLFGSQTDSSTKNVNIEKKFTALENQIKELQKKIIKLDNQTIDSNHALRGLLKGSESYKNIKHSSCSKRLF